VQLPTRGCDGLPAGGARSSEHGGGQSGLTQPDPLQRKASLTPARVREHGRARAGTALQSRPRAKTGVVDFVQTAETPDGQRYMVVTAPPGSALDASGGPPAGGIVGAVAALVMVFIRSGRRGWRIAVNPCDSRGRPTGTTHRERVADRAAAEARATAVTLAIRDGRWPERPE
jgi:hypothetical protein